MASDSPKVKWSDKSEARLKELVGRARRKFQRLYPGQSFDAQVWKAAHLVERPSAHHHNHLGFTTLLSNSKRGYLSTNPADALPSYFADAVKSYVVCGSEVTVAYNSIRLRAARHFWNFLITKQSARAVTFRWGSLTENDFLAFEQYLKVFQQGRNGKKYKADTINGYITELQALADFLLSHKICRRINYVPQTAPLRGDQRIKARRLAAERKLPAPGVLEALGEIYHRMTTAPEGEINPWELILISGVAVQMLTGLRMGELVTLPEDCEVEEAVAKKDPGGPAAYRYGIKFWAEKARNKAPRIRWVSPTAEPIVRAAVARVKALTADARERAKALEADPFSIPLPAELTGQTELTTAQIVDLLGHKTVQLLWKKPAYEQLPRTHKECYRNYYSIEDVKAFLLGRRVKHLFTMRHADGTFQMLSETLFISFDNQSRFRRTNECRLLVKPIKASQFQRFMTCPAPGEASRTAVFTRYGTTEEQKLLSAHSHSFRHWLNHIAYKGKMEVHLITRYFARENPRDTRDYLHYTPEETGAYVREEIRAGRVFGPVAKTYWSLPPGLREDYLIGQVSVGHFTPWGLCVRNFSIKPCDKHLNCLNDCGSFCSTKGNKEEIAALLDLQFKTKTLLRLAEEALASGQEWAEAWTTYHRRTLTKISVVLFKHREGGTEDEAVIRPFGGKPSRHLSADH